MIPYLINSTLCLLLLYLMYRLFFQNERMHLFNRFFILVALIVGLLLPTQDFFQSNTMLRMQPNDKVAGIEAQTFVDIKRGPVMLFTNSVFPKGEKLPQNVSELSDINGSPSPLEEPFPLALMFFSIYATVTFIMLLKYGYGIFHIVRKARTNEKISVADTNAQLVLLDEEVSPHSFMDYIFVSKEEYQKGRINKDIIDHELAHLKGYHTLDLLFVELIKTFCWWNPGVYLFSRALQINHEFWADEQVIKKTNDVSDYQKQLLEAAVSNKQILLASNLNFFLTKQRMQMMTKKISHIRHSIKKVALVPLLPLLVLIYGLHTFSIKNLNHNTSNIELTADSLTISPELKVIKWKDPEGNYYTGSKKTYDNRTGILRVERIYEDGREMEYRSYNELGQAGMRSFNTYDGNIPATSHNFFWDHLVLKEIFPHPDNDYIGTYMFYNKQGNLEYHMTYKGNRLNTHGLETSYDENGKILNQKRYKDGELIETIK